MVNYKIFSNVYMTVARQKPHTSYSVYLPFITKNFKWNSLIHTILFDFQPLLVWYGMTRIPISWTSKVLPPPASQEDMHTWESSPNNITARSPKV